MKKTHLCASAVISTTIVLGGCSSTDEAWEWTSAEDAVSNRNVEYYYDYPADDEVALGAVTALVRIVALEHNVAVPASEGAEPWVYTPATVQIIEPGNSGLKVGEELTLAIPGGNADGISSPSLWVFDKAELDSRANYVFSWAHYQYPGFKLSDVLQYVYEETSSGFVRLQSEPDAVGKSAHPSFEAADVAAEMAASDGRLSSLSKLVADAPSTSE